MANYTLVIGNKAYSSWSLRPWLLMKHAGIAFDEIRIPLYADGAKQKRAALLRRRQGPGAAGRRPDDLGLAGDLRIPGRKTSGETALAVQTSGARAQRALGQRRNAFRLRQPAQPHADERAPRDSGPGRTPEVLAEIARIQAIWNDCRSRHRRAGSRFCSAIFHCRRDVCAGGVALSHLRGGHSLAQRREYADFDPCPAGDAGMDRRRPTPRPKSLRSTKR